MTERVNIAELPDEGCVFFSKPSEVNINLSIKEMSCSISERTSIPLENVEKVVNAFIEYYLVGLKLK